MSTVESKKAEEITSPTNKNKTQKKQEDDISPEDRKLKEVLSEYVATIMTPKPASQSQSDYDALQKTALDEISREIRSATSSMTAIPKPLKFLRPSYQDLEEFYKDETKLHPDSPNKPLLADILSVLAMTIESDDRPILQYRLRGSSTDVASWGHEYLRALAGQVSREYEARMEKLDETAEPNEMIVVEIDDLLPLVDTVVEHLFAHGGEIEASDLLFDIGQLHRAVAYVRDDNVIRVGRYLIACASYLADVEKQAAVYQVCLDIFLQHKHLVFALVVAIKLPDEASEEAVKKIFAAADTLPEDDDAEADATLPPSEPAAAHVAALRRGPVRTQLCHVVSGMQACRAYMEELVSDEEWMVMGGGLKSGLYKTLCKDLDVLAPRAPADIYKEHLQEGTSARRPRPSSIGGPLVDSAIQNMASSFTNAFANVGTGAEALLQDSSDWLYRNKGSGMVVATASVGLVHLWDVEEGFTAADRYSFAKEPQIQAGAALATGVLATGITSELNATLAILSEQLNHDDLTVRVCAALGLGLGYINTRNPDVLEVLAPLVADTDVAIELASMAALALGMVFLGSGDQELCGTLLSTLVERQEGKDLDTIAARYMCMGMGMLFFGTGVPPQGVIDSLAAVEHQLGSYLSTTVTSMVYAGTGNTVALQQLMAALTTKAYSVDDDDADEDGPNADNPTDDKGNKFGLLRHIHQSAAVLGAAAVASGDALTRQLLPRAFDHALQCSEANVRRAVALAMGLNSVSNPDIGVVDALLKLAHDQDRLVAMNACFALGLVGAGTNNSRIAQTLRGLAAYFALEPQHLYCVRIAQSLVHLGKGICTLDPVQMDGLTVNKPALASLMVVLHSCIDMPNVLVKNYPYMLYAIAPAIRPRGTQTVAADGETVVSSVRVGQGVDNVGQPGNPRTLTGFQTHNTPVLVAYGERVELTTDDYSPMSPILEGPVVVRKNPHSVSKEI